MTYGRSREGQFKTVKEVITTQAFKELRQEGIIARSNFDCCGSCATHHLSYDVGEKNKEGAVYWTRQDNRRATEYTMEGNELHIRYFINKDNATKEESAEFGFKVYAALLKQKMTGSYVMPIDVIWDGNPSATIVIKWGQE